MLDQVALNKLFYNARTHFSWKKKDISDALLKQVYELAALGPTSANCCPMRVLFIKSAEAKETLKPALAPENVEKTMEAPVTAIIAYDTAFFEHLPILFPHTDARAWFVDNEALAKETAFRNGTLQGAYFILAARSLGLDCGPMSGFDSEKVNKLFFKDTTYLSNFLCNLGYGEPNKLHPRHPRLSFEQACHIL